MQRLVGVVSTNPAQTIGTAQVPNGYPIALSGRVPTKVNAEGGPIAVGDKITISSVSGVGKKTTSATMVVGTAVEAFNGSGNGVIEVFVNLTYFDPTDGNNLQAQSGNFQDLNVSGNTTLQNLTVSGPTTLASLTVNESATFNGSIAFSANTRGKNETVVQTQNIQTITGKTYSDNDYSVLCTPNYNTTCFVTDKTSTGFTLNFGTAAPTGAKVDWIVVR